MVTLKAVHEIVRGGAGKRETIAPGSLFQTEGSEAEYLLRIGAAVKAAGGAAPVAAPPIPVVSTGEGGGDDDGNPEDDGGGEDENSGDDGEGKSLSEMTVKELRARADALGIEVDANAKKADLLEALIEAEEDII